jgi:NADAR domain
MLAPSPLGSLQFSKRSARNARRCEVAAHECFDLAGPTGLEPATCVLRKFESHPDIAAILLGTGDEDLVEKTTGDHYWGCGSTGTGKNMLGRILMEVRATLRGEKGRAPA